MYAEKAFGNVNFTLSLVLVIFRGFEKSKIECKKHIWHKIFKNGLIHILQIVSLGPMYMYSNTSQQKKIKLMNKKNDKKTVFVNKRNNCARKMSKLTA